MDLIQNVIGIGQLILNLFGALGDFFLFECSTFAELEGWQYGFQTMWGYLDLSINTDSVVYPLISTPLGLADEFLNFLGIENAPICVALIVVAFFVTIAIVLIIGIIRAILNED